jgi:hypothetical protein
MFHPRLQCVWAYDTDVLATGPCAWAGANGLAGAFGRHRLRRCARGRHRVLAHHSDRSTLVSAPGCAEFFLIPAAAARFFYSAVASHGESATCPHSSRQANLGEGRDRGALRKIAAAASGSPSISWSRTATRWDQCTGTTQMRFISNLWSFTGLEEAALL